MRRSAWDASCSRGCARAQRRRTRALPYSDSRGRMQDATRARIQSNIDKHGQHVYYVFGSSYPRFIYSIGVSSRIGFEIIIGGSAYFARSQVVEAINECASQLSKAPAPLDVSHISLPFGE